MASTQTEPVIEWSLVGHVGVDTGQIMVGDPSYLDDFVNDDFAGEKEPEYSYSGAAATSVYRGGGVIGQFDQFENPTGRAVVTPTAFGDGVFPVYQIFEDGELVGLHIDLV